MTRRGTPRHELVLLPVGWIVAALFTSIVVTVQGQLFTEQTGIRLTGVMGASVTWGDYDNDGKLDILLAGQSADGKVAKVYRNNGDNTFTEQTDIVLTGVTQGSLAWGDYDNDGDLDILLTGGTTGYPTWASVSEMYRNFEGTFLKQSAVALTGVLEGDVAWGDYDNDGNLDILLTGYSGGGSIAKIYRNNGNNTFTELTSAGLPGVSGSSASWGDYDNDGDLDIALMGHDSGWTTISAIYRNNGNGTFSKQTGIALSGVDYGSIAWGDYDSDGDLDLALCGYQGPGKVAKVYRNNGGNTFQEQPSIVLPGVHEGRLKWGDYDNDGDLDILLTGSDANNHPLSVVYRNDGDNTFSKDTDVILEGVFGLSSCAWGDYDGDGDLDILLAGATSNSVAIAKVYRNNTGVQNKQPQPPLGLKAMRQGSKVQFSWRRGNDSKTPVLGLSYNLRIGKSIWTGDILSPMAHAITGTRRLSSIGPIQGTNWTVDASTLTNSVYHWSVQAVDAALAGSPFGTEHIFSGDTDTDEDGLSDSGEADWGTSSTNRDSDADALTDGEEVYIYGTLPLLPDTDGDYMKDGAEITADTNPLNSTSVLSFSAIRNTNGSSVVTWKGGVTATQYLERITTGGLQSAMWAPVFTNVPPTSVTNTFADPSALPQGNFYRLRAVRDW